jgi:hypothetical protein
MRWITKGVVVTALMGGVVVVGRIRGVWSRSRLKGRGSRDGRWHVVTVNQPQSLIAPNGQLPEPLAELEDRIEVQLRPAAGGRGTEIAVRLRDGGPSGLGAMIGAVRGARPVGEVRWALRESKQLIETGEVLRPHFPPTTQRTLLGRPVEYATRHGREGGML